MAALGRLFGDEVACPTGRVKAGDKGVPSPPARSSVGSAPAHVSALPLLPIPDVPRLEQHPARYRFLSELDGPDYDQACDAADVRAVERDLAVYGQRDSSTRSGWSDENRAT